jgi:hypothetical protein
MRKRLLMCACLLALPLVAYASPGDPARAAVVATFKCPAACPGPNGQYKTECVRNTCVSTPRPQAIQGER